MIKYLYINLIFLVTSCSSPKLGDHLIRFSDCKFENSKSYKCDKIKFKNITFNIQHENFRESDLKDYELLISLDGIVYKGKYIKKVTLNDFPVCNENGKSIVSIIIALIDLKNDRCYLWQNDDSYSLNKLNEVEIILKSETTYGIDESSFLIKSN